MNASGQQIAQSRPSDTSAVSVYTASILTEITKIVICNTTGSGATFRIFHDDDGSTFDQTTALYYDTAIGANATTVIDAQPNSGLMVRNGGQIAVRSGTGNALNFTLYGVTANLARVNE